MIPDDVIAEIRSRVDIVAVIGQHVQLKKAGRNWKGLCPFHGERSPSFNVSPDKGFFYCFGCHKKGDAFTFVMEYEGRSFLEAAEQLAAKTGIVLPQIEESPALRKARGERALMLEVNKLATQFFRETLAHPERGAPGRAYLEKRGIGAATSERFQLGYAPAEWHLLADFLRARRFDPEIAIKVGLIARQVRAGGFYDRFRDRLVCPVIVPGGEVTGFSARVVGEATTADGAPLAKYINSPESTVYKKSKLLFGLAQARESFAAKKRAVVVEGNFDVITLHQAGFTEVVAPLGTALTVEQADALRRLSDEVVVCYDGDRAGRTATRAALEVLVAADVPVRIVALPDGEDPDSLVSKGGTDKLTQMIDRAQGGIEYFAFEVWGRARDSADARARALEDAVRLTAKVANQTKRDLITGTLASAMSLPPAKVQEALDRALRQQRTAPSAPGPSYGAHGASHSGGSQRTPFTGSRGGPAPTAGRGPAPSQGQAPARGAAPSHRQAPSNAPAPSRGPGPSPTQGQPSSRGAAPAPLPGPAPSRGSAPAPAQGKPPSPGPAADTDRSSSERAPHAADGAPYPADGVSHFADAVPHAADGPHFAEGSERFDADDHEPPDDRSAARPPDRDDRGAPAGQSRSAGSTDRGGRGGRGDQRSPHGTFSDDDRRSAAPTRTPPIAPAPTEELEVFALLADHPQLLATADSLGVFSLLTDARLRDMYSASREGHAVVELAPVHLPPANAELVLSAKYVSETDPNARLEALTSGLRRRVEHDRLQQLRTRMTEAQRRGDRELVQQIVAEIVSTRKQVD